jgi:anti-sigma-K factor RskA
MAESCFTSETYALYVIGSLDGEDFREFDQHLRTGCDVCRGELVQASGLWTAFAASTPPVVPRPEVRQRILAAARRTAPVPMPPRRSIRQFASWPQAIAAGVVLAAGIGLGWLLRQPAPVTQIAQTVPPAQPAPTPAPGLSQAEAENRTLRTRIAELDKTLAAQEARIRESAGQSKSAIDLEQALARARAESAANAQSLQQTQARASQAEAQAKQLQGQVSTAEARARDAEQRYQTAENDRKLAVDREARLRETTAARIRQLEGENEKFRRVIDDQQRRVEQNLQLASFFSSPNLRFYQYQGTRNGQGARAHVIAQEGSRVMFYAFNLPRLPTGRTYQLWIIRGQSPAIVSGGIFQPDQNGNAVVQFSDASMLRNVRQFAVTDEPDGGSRGPTGRQFLRAAS